MQSICASYVEYTFEKSKPKASF